MPLQQGRQQGQSTQESAAYLVFIGKAICSVAFAIPVDSLMLQLWFLNYGGNTITMLMKPTQDFRTKRFRIFTTTYTTQLRLILKSGYNFFFILYFYCMFLFRINKIKWHLKVQNLCDILDKPIKGQSDVDTEFVWA